MLKTLGGSSKISPDKVIGTPKRAPKIKSDEILYGQEIIKKHEFLTD